ncbi:hypothetical protein L6R53_27945 [Myxococcota bacterium]|nr:hypothetical protein [Myxococcota bacterium]
MSWSDTDKKKVRGPVDRIWVSTTESWELAYFIDAYLRSRGYNVDDSNQQIVRASIARYTGTPPVSRTELEAYLDRLYQKSA